LWLTGAYSNTWALYNQYPFGDTPQKKGQLRLVLVMSGNLFKSGTKHNYDYQDISVIAVLFIAISYELHQIGDVNLYAVVRIGVDWMVVLRTNRAVHHSNSLNR
jgi:hypothetical protein